MMTIFSVLQNELQLPHSNQPCSQLFQLFHESFPCCIRVVVRTASLTNIMLVWLSSDEPMWIQSHGCSMMNSINCKNRILPVTNRRKLKYVLNKMESKYYKLNHSPFKLFKAGILCRYSTSQTCEVTEGGQFVLPLIHQLRQ